MCTPKAIHALMPRICEYVSLRGKKDFEDVNELGSWGRESSLDYTGELNLIRKRGESFPAVVQGRHDYKRMVRNM